MITFKMDADFELLFLTIKVLSPRFAPLETILRSLSFQASLGIQTECSLATVNT